MAALSARHILLLVVAVPALAQAQAAPAAGVTPAWTLKVPGGGDIRWQQVTPAGGLLVSPDAALAGVDIEHGAGAGQRPRLGGLPAASGRVGGGAALLGGGGPGRPG